MWGRHEAHFGQHIASDLHLMHRHTHFEVASRSADGRDPTPMAKGSGARAPTPRR